MNRLHPIPAGTWFLACFLVFGAASAEPRVMERVGSLFDNIGQGLSFVGRKAGDLVGPGLGLGEKGKGDFSHTRQVTSRHPVGPAPMVAISSEFGRIEVETWANPVVEVNAEIQVGAETAETAQEIAEGTEVQVTATEERLEIRTRLPDTRKENGNLSITVNYTVTVPADANLITENFFGDTWVRNVGGTVAIDAQYGLVDVRNVGGPVRLRSRGAFPVDAEGLGQGGTFELSGAEATLKDIGGKVQVSNFGGGVEIREVAPEIDLSVTNEGGHIALYLPEDAAPDLSATCLFGSIKSDLALGQRSQGNVTVARSPNVESAQGISLNASFGDIFIKREGSDMTPAPVIMEETLPFKDVVTHSELVSEGTELVVEAMRGDVRVEGVDEDEVRVEATLLVRVEDEADVEAALETLLVKVEKEEDRLVVRSRKVGDMAGLGCVAYRVDLKICCPRTCPVVVRAQDGYTMVNGTGEKIRVEQEAGTVAVEHAKGALELANEKGGGHGDGVRGPGSGFGTLWHARTQGSLRRNLGVVRGGEDGSGLAARGGFGGKFKGGCAGYRAGRPGGELPDHGGGRASEHSGSEGAECAVRCGGGGRHGLQRGSSQRHDQPGHSGVSRPFGRGNARGDVAHQGRGHPDRQLEVWGRTGPECVLSFGNGSATVWPSRNPGSMVTSGWCEALRK